jgi:PIN domain nuclease of toxin-antitoxin system
MRIILDTHVLLWVLADSPQINQIKPLILSNETEIYISTASWWELAIKISIGKIGIKLDEIRAASADSGFIDLPVLGAHTQTLLTLPLLHRDPFDRMLVAQAISEPMQLLTNDTALQAYSNLVTII